MVEPVPFPKGKDPRDLYPDLIADNTRGAKTDPPDPPNPELLRPQTVHDPANPDEVERQRQDGEAIHRRIIEEQIRQELERVGQQAANDIGDYVTVGDGNEDAPVTDYVGPFITQNDLIGGGAGRRTGRRAGVQYVVGTPPQTPVLRPLRQTMYDRLVLNPGTTRTIAFVDNRFFDDHSPKTLADTNMTQCGCLGYPLEYDLERIAVHPFGRGEEYKRRWDQFISHGVTAAWFFGANVAWIREPVAMMREEFPVRANELENNRYHNVGFPEILAAIAREVPLPRYSDLRTPDRRARRISSTESFRMDFDLPARAWTLDPFSFYAAMHGTLYAQL